MDKIKIMEEVKHIPIRINTIYALFKNLKFLLLALVVLVLPKILRLDAVFDKIFYLASFGFVLRFLYGFFYYKLVLYVIYSDRLKVVTGVFSKKEEYLELYRVEDISSTQPFLLRLIGLEHITLYTVDKSTPQVHLVGIKKVGLIDVIRRNSEEMRDIKKVRIFESN